MNEHHNYKIMTGNEACAHGAVAAGMRFYAGYPITPATEIMETCADLLPKVGGVFMQMEDELASMGAVLGASFAGFKAMTATAASGFDLIQENLGFGIFNEVPCVVVDVQRDGPNQGTGTGTMQGELMHAKWGSHGGNKPAVVLVPSSVSEVYTETIRAFNLAERFRTPVILLSDATLAHMSEKVHIPDLADLKIVDRKYAEPNQGNKVLAYSYGDDLVPKMPVFGDGNRYTVTGVTHGKNGLPVTNDPSQTEQHIKRILAKIDMHVDEIESWEEYMVEDADVLLVAVGLTGRCVKGAVEEMRKVGMKVGLFRPLTLWPFPEKKFRELSDKASTVITCELNEGQLYEIARSVIVNNNKVVKLTQSSGLLLTAEQIINAVKETNYELSSKSDN